MALDTAPPLNDILRLGKSVSHHVCEISRCAPRKQRPIPPARLLSLLNIAPAKSAVRPSIECVDEVFDMDFRMPKLVCYISVPHVMWCQSCINKPCSLYDLGIE